MARKGDKARLAPLAMRLYSEGVSIPEIAAHLDVSETTLRRWKSASLRPGEAMDEWDEGREKHRSRTQRVCDLFDREIQAAEQSPAGSIKSKTLNTLVQLSAMVHRMLKAEKEQLQAAREKERENAPDVDRPRMFLEFMEFVATHLKENDPGGLAVLSRNFEGIVAAFKAGYEKEA